MPQYSWLLFDADGTLFDFAKAEADAIAAVLADLKLPYSPERIATYQRINQALWKELEQGNTTQAEIKTKRFALWLDAMGVKADAEEIGHDYALHLSQQTTLIDGAQEVVERLAERHKLLLITNGLKEVQRPRFERSRIRHHFADIVISAEIGIAKPDAGIFDAAFACMQQPDKQSVLMIGDSLTADIAGGHNYGLDTCWCNFKQEPRPANPPITHVIEEIQELPKILG